MFLTKQFIKNKIKKVTIIIFERKITKLYYNNNNNII